MNRISVIAIVLFLGLIQYCNCAERRFYLTATQINWSYVPAESEEVNVNSFNKTYQKIVYQRYENITFTRRLPHPAHLGYFGPVLAAEVGDVIIISLKNLANKPVSITSNGVQIADDRRKPVFPGEIGEYVWNVTEAFSPTYMDPMCIPNFYYSDENQNIDPNSGTIGCLLVCKKHGIPNEKEKNNVLFFAISKEREMIHGNGTAVVEKFSINGYSNKTLPLPSICTEETQTWYIFGLSSIPTSFPISFGGLDIRTSSGIINTVMLYPWTAKVVMISARKLPKIFEISSLSRQHYLQGMVGSFNVENCSEDKFNSIFSEHYQSAVVTDNRECRSKIRVQTYYLCVEKVLWNYAPTGFDIINGDQLKSRRLKSSKKFRSEENRIGARYMKAQYILYENSNFTSTMKRTREETHMGILGPVLHVGQGEILRVVLKNNVSHPFNIFIPGLKLLTKFNSKGVDPMTIRTYEWRLPENRIPSRNAAPCFMTMYYSSVNPIRDLATGLLGPVQICRDDSIRTINTKVDREIFLHIATHDENLSWFIEENLQGATDIREEQIPDVLQSKEFKASNIMQAINGYAFGNIPYLESRVGEYVKLYFSCSGDGDDAHNMKVVGQILTNYRARSFSILPSVLLSPGTSATAYMHPNRPGITQIRDFNFEAEQLGIKARLIVKSARSSLDSSDDSSHPQDGSAIIRWYYIAAREVEWKFQVDVSSNRSRSYKKVIFQEFTDSTFRTLKMKNADNMYMGLIGPVIRAEAGDTIKVTFQNQGCRPFSMQPKDLNFNHSDSGEWALTNKIEQGLNFTHFNPKYSAPGIVWPGNTHTYTWYVPHNIVPKTSGLAPVCVPSYYFSAVDPIRDVHSGLFGPMLMCEKGTMDAEGKTKGVEKVDEFILFFKTFNERQSWYYEENMQSMNEEVQGLEEDDVYPTINGFSYGSMPTFHLSANEYVLWNVANLNFELLPVHFGGNHVIEGHHPRSDNSPTTKILFPGNIEAFVMVSLQTGIWKISNFIKSYGKDPCYCIYHISPSVCRKPLGLASRSIKDKQISASSMHVVKGVFGFTTARWKPSNARLHNRGRIHGWIPARFDKRPWLQVDLGSTTKVTGVLMQGVTVGFTQKYVKIFKILYSRNGVEWTYAKRLWSKYPMVFDGNFDANVQVKRDFVPPLFARYIKIMTIAWHNQPALRIELLGCERTIGCDQPVGIGWNAETKSAIADYALSASSVFMYKSSLRWEPKYGRLNYISDGRNQKKTAPGWSPRKSSRHEWIQVDLGERILISGIVTQGATYKNAHLFVKSFLLLYSDNGYEWDAVANQFSGSHKIFDGNFDSETAIIQNLNSVIAARYVRIQPWSWTGRIALRFEIIGCRIHSVDNEEKTQKVTPIPDNCVAEVIQ